MENQKDQTPLEIQEVIKSSFEALMKKVQEIASNLETERHYNCPSCGTNQTISKDNTNIYENLQLGVRLTVPGLVCKNCGEVGYEATDYKVILEAEEAAQGRSYIRYEIKDGQLHKHSLH